MKYTIVLLLSIFSCCQMQAQEILATVRILTPQLQKTDRKVFDALEASVKDLLNTTKWTDDVFDFQEKIKCSFTITISTEIGDNAFAGELAVQAVRPVYGSSYESPLLSHLDKDCSFTYDQYQALDFSRDNIDNNLTAMLAFYVYTILGMDYDSFSPYGGDSYHFLAQQIINNVPPAMSSRFKGWSLGENNKNRFWINENLLSPRVKPYRLAMYNYHRKGLDLMSSDLEKGKQGIMAALDEVEKVNAAYFNAIIIQMFSNAKRSEIIEIWKRGTKAQREHIFQVMTKVDASNTSRYREIGI